MNYCRKCQSDYEKPGTCNCFAEGTQGWIAPTTLPFNLIYPGTSPWTNPIYISPTILPMSPYKYETTCGTVGWS